MNRIGVAVALLLACGLASAARAGDRAEAEGGPLRVIDVGAGPTVVLIPWLSGGAFSFRHVAGALETGGYRVLTVEPLGVGHSPRPAQGDYSLDAQADRVVAELDRHGVKRAVLAGHGLGASIALRVALRRPDLAASIVSIEGGPAESPSTPSLRRAMKFAGIIKLFVTKEKVRKRVREMMIRASADPAWVDDAMVEAYAAAAVSDVKRTIDVLKAISKSREREALAPRLPSVACPVELLVGDVPHEGSVPDDQIDLLLRSLPAFVLTEVPGAGYFIQEEKPGAVVDAVIRASRQTRGALAPAAISVHAGIEAGTP